MRNMGLRRTTGGVSSLPDMKGRHLDLLPLVTLAGYSCRKLHKRGELVSEKTLLPGNP
jgi:hypothetical protein